ISDPAVLAVGGFSVNATEGADSATQTLATFTDPGGAEPVGDYSATVIGRAASRAAGAISLGADGQTYSVTGSHNYDGEVTYAVTVTIHHDAAADSTVVSSATVSDPAVLAVGGFSVNATEGAVSGTQTLATFTDPGGAEPVGDYIAT